MAKQKKSAVSVPIVLVFMIALIGIAAGIILILRGGSAKDNPLNTADNGSSIELDVLTPYETTTEVTATTTMQETTATTVSLLPGSVTGIELTFYNVTLQVGGRSVMPIVTMKPEDADDKSEKWESSDERVAKVDSQGSITPVGAGRCTIRVTSVNNPNVFAEVDVIVADPAATAQTSSQTTAGTAANTNTDASSAAPGTTAATTASSSNERSDMQVIDGITYIQGVMIVNKTYSIPADYNPGGMTAETKAAFTELQNAASADGLSLYSVSDFRSYETQRTLYNNYVARDGQAAADRYSARPGNSEHQTGLAIDCNCAGDAFIGTPEAIWLAEHSWEYGFIIRYGADKEALTGYKYEPWHIRYVGKEWAKKIYDSGLCLEEYFNIDSVYPN